MSSHNLPFKEKCDCNCQECECPKRHFCCKCGRNICFVEGGVCKISGHYLIGIKADDLTCISCYESCRRL